MDPMTTIFKGMHEANTHKANARAALQEAAVATDQAAREEGQSRRDRDQLVGSQIAATGASGVTQDSSASFIIDQAVQSELNALNARYAGQVKSTGLHNQAKVQKWQARGALTGAILKGTTDAIKGAAGAGKYGPA